MKLFGKIGISILLLFITFSCEEEIIQSIPVEQEFPFEISAADYSDSHFFLDTIYRHIFEDYHQTYPPNITSEMMANSINEIDVWISTTNMVELSLIYATAYINLPSKDSPSSLYDTTYDTLINPTQGKSEVGFFRKLVLNQDFIIHDMEGYISLRTKVNDDQAIAVAYSTNDKKYFGEFAGIDTAPHPSYTLKLIKPKYLNSSLKPAFDLMLKNIYKLDSSFSTLQAKDFDLEIMFRTQNRIKDTLFLGEHLLRIIGFDYHSDTAGYIPDNTFDFLPMFTIDKKYAEIIFPTLRPFDKGIKKYFKQKNPSVTVPDSLLFSAPYDSMQSIARRSPMNRFFIKWRIQNH